METPKRGLSYSCRFARLLNELNVAGGSKFKAALGLLSFKEFCLTIQHVASVYSRI